MREQVRKRLLELRRAKHEELYLSYVNDFLTVVNWCEYYGMNEVEGMAIIGLFQEVA